ncbi:MAG: TonB-dependent siderophore receptor, partial [Nitrosomonas sp. PRO4]|nr:TonB-dependent siderophore receptor [Nitrosomonas sp. PRO4]
IPASKFDLANVERLEVLKGASAMLYGFSDPGGMISTVTKQPSSQPYYSVEQRFGSYNFFRTEVSATGPLSKENGLNYRVDLSYLNTDSFRQLISHDRIFLAPSLSWQVTPDTKLSFSYEYLDENKGYDYGIPAFGNRLANIPRSRTFTNPGLQDHQTNHLIDFRIDHRYNDNFRFNAGTVAAQNRKNWESLYTGRVVEQLDPLNPDRKLGDVDRFYWFSPEKVRTLTAWVNGMLDFETYGVKHKVLLGGEYHVATLDYQVANDKADTINIFTFDPRGSNLPIDQYRNLPTDTYSVDTRSTSQAIYLQNQMTFWEKLHILGGFRYDWVERYQNLSWWAPDEKDKRNDSFISPRVGILYEPTHWLSLFGSFSESFGPAFAYDTGGPRLYKFDAATQFEGGLKTQFFEGRLMANLVYFDLEKTQLVADPSGQNIRLSVPIRGKSRGIEFDMQGQIYKGLSVIGTYAYTDTKTLADPSAPENVGNRLPYAPVHQGSAWLKYDFNDDWLKGFSIGAGVFAAGRRFGDATNSYFDGSYARVDLMVAYRKKLRGTTLTAQLNINNVNDTEYFILRNRRSNLPGEPLMVMGSMRLQY